MSLPAARIPYELPDTDQWPGVISLVTPREASSALLALLAAQVLSDGRIYLLDGVKAFDPYAFSRTAREQGVSDDILNRVFVSSGVRANQEPTLAAFGTP